MNYIEELKQKLAGGAKISDLISHLPEDFDIDAFLSKIESENSADKKVVPKLPKAALGCFTTIDIPDLVYTSNTTKLDIEGLTRYHSYSSIGDADLTVKFSTPLTKYPLPADFWGDPPSVESNIPPILYTDDAVSSMTFNLSKPVCTFGFELMFVVLSAELPVTIEFYSGDELVGTIQKLINGNARLFAAKTCSGTPFDRLELSIDELHPYGFVIAQFRYNADCSSKYDSCLSAPIPITIEAGNDLATLPLQIPNSCCNGRLLGVDVTVTACQKRSVIVSVIVCDSTKKKVLSLKSCEACMPESTDPNTPNVQNTFNFLFVFEKELSNSLQLNVKTLVEYACFDFSI